MKLEEKKVREKRAKRIKKSYKRKIGNRMKSQKKKKMKMKRENELTWRNERCLNKKKKKIDEHGGKWIQAVREEERKEIVIKRL